MGGHGRRGQKHARPGLLDIPVPRAGDRAHSAVVKLIGRLASRSLRSSAAPIVKLRLESPPGCKPMSVLEVQNLKTYFFTRRGVIKAVDGVSFSLGAGEALGLVGESGCGKSVTALSILRLLPRPAGKIVDGKILFQGENLLEKTENEMRAMRGK